MGLFNSKKKQQLNDEQDISNKNETSMSETENIEESASNVKEELEERDMFDNGESESDTEVNIVDDIDKVIDYFTQADPIKLNMLERGKIKKEDFEAEVENYIRKEITKDTEKAKQIFDGFASFVWRYDILDELIDDDTISDIKVYDYDHIRVKRLGHREGSHLTFRSERHYIKFIEHVAIKNKVSIADQNAAQNFVDKESSEKAILRFNITTGFINSSGKPVLHIRKIPKTKLTEQQLIDLKFFTKEAAEIIKERIVTGDGFLLAGRGGSGKTTCINYMLDFIPYDRSALVIQENEELHSNHPDMAFEHTVQNRGEGKIEYNLGDLARNGLLTDIDYFIIGEIKGGEALYLLNAIYTGAKGWASVHGASAQEAMKKLVDYIKYNSDYSQKEAMEMLVHLSTVIFMEDFQVKEIVSVDGFDADKGDMKYTSLYKVK